GRDGWSFGAERGGQNHDDFDGCGPVGTGSGRGPHPGGHGARRFRSAHAPAGPRSAGTGASRRPFCQSEPAAFRRRLPAESGAALHRAIDAALDLAGLTDRARDRVSTFSGGMKRRLNLGAALLHQPQILLLDEPTVGVDPQSRNAIFTSLEELRRQGKALVYTTHYMEEAERLCDQIVIIDHGKVIANHTL